MAEMEKTFKARRPKRKVHQGQYTGAPGNEAEADGNG